MEEEEKLKLKKFVEQLESYKGRHTQLVTVYIPAGANIFNTAKQVFEEQSTAKNIKSTNTRKAVLDSLERISRHLRLFKQTPKNGLAIFAGNISPLEGQEQIEVFSIEPPQPLKVKLYRCDQTFVLEPLKEMLEVQEIYGLIAIERDHATVGVLEGKNITVIRKFTSGIPGKTEKGGQSAARYSRIREGMAKEYFRRVAEGVKEIFFNMSKLKGLLVGGPGTTKDEFLKEGELVTKLKEMVLAVKDIGYTDEFGLKNLVEVSQEELAKQEITLEKNLLKKFFTTLASKPSYAVYGLAETKKALEMGAAGEVFISTYMHEDIINEIKQKAANVSAEFHLISTETEEGVQFRHIGGVGAILRYPI